MLTFHFFKIYYLDQVLNDLSKKFTINKRANNFVISLAFHYTIRATRVINKTMGKREANGKHT